MSKICRRQNKNSLIEPHHCTKILGVMVLVGVFLLILSGIATAGITKTFVEDTEKKLELSTATNYGTIALKDRYWLDVFGWFDKPVQTITLTHHTDQCLINCETAGTSTLYVDGTLFDGKKFVDRFGSDADVNAKYYIKEIEYYDVTIPNTYKTTCVDIVSNVTLKEGEKAEPVKQECYEEVDTWKNETREREIWNEYKNTILKAGTYEWKVLATKKPQESIDFIPIAQGVELKEWAWWDSDWSYCRTINVTSGYDFTTGRTDVAIINLSSGSFKADGGDIRIVDTFCENNGTEVPYNIISASASSVVVSFKVDNMTGTSLQYSVYYGNSEATTTEDNNVPIYLSNETNLKTITNTTEWNITLISEDGISWRASGGALGGGYDTSLNSYGNDAWLGIARSPTFYLGTSFTHYSRNNNEANELYGIDINNTGTIDLSFGNTNGNAFRNLDTSAYKGQLASVYLQDASAGSGGWLAYHEGNITIGGIATSSYPLISTLGAEQENVVVGSVVVTLNSPANNLKSQSQTINFNATLTPTAVNITNATIFVDGVSSYFETINSNETRIFNWSNNFADGYYTSWYIVACYDDGLIINCTTSATRSFSIDSNPPTISWVYPALLGPSFINYGYLGKQEYVNWTVNDNNLDSCWLDYEGTNYTVSCVNGTINQLNYTIPLVNPIRITAWANDTFGNVADSFVTPDYKVWENARVFPEEFYVTTSSAFKLNITTDGTQTPTVHLVFDGSTYTSTLTDGFYVSNVEPATIGLKEFYWNITYGTNQIITYTSNTTVFALGESLVVDGNCPAGLTKALNFTFYDEQNQTAIPSVSVNYYFQYGITNSTGQSLFGSIVATELSVCVNYTESSSFIFGYGELEYTKDGYSDRTYWLIDETTVTNATTTSYNLFLLLTESSTKFFFTVYQGFEAVTDAIVNIQKSFISEGTYRNVVQTRTDNIGEFTTFLEMDKPHRFTVIQDGVVIGTVDRTTTCANSPCTIELQMQDLTNDWVTEILDDLNKSVTYSLIHNPTTNIVTAIFVDLTGTADYFRLLVLSGNTAECDDYLYTSAGSMSCNLTGLEGEYTAQLFISRSPEVELSIIGISLGTIAISIGLTGIFLSLIIILMIVFAVRADPTVMLILLPIALAFLKIMQILNLSWPIISVIALFSVWIASKLRT